MYRFLFVTEKDQGKTKIINYGQNPEKTDKITKKNRINTIFFRLVEKYNLFLESIDQKRESDRELNEKGQKRPL